MGLVRVKILLYLNLDGRIHRKLKLAYFALIYRWANGSLRIWGGKKKKKALEIVQRFYGFIKAPEFSQS